MPHQQLKFTDKTNHSQLGALCSNMELRKYQGVERSHLVTDYKYNLSLLNKVFFEGAPPVNGYKKGPISAKG